MTARAFLLATVAALIAGPAVALDTPTAGRRDERVRSVDYRPEDVTRLVAAVGETLAIELSANEIITSVLFSDSENLMVTPAPLSGGHHIFVKAKVPLRPQPFFVLTRRQDGTTRRYNFEFRTREAPDPGPAFVAGPGAPSASPAEGFYAVRFAYPADDAADRARRAREAAEVNRERVAIRRLREAASAPAGAENISYGARGARELAPSKGPNGEHAIWDDGHSTHLRFPGNRRMPTFYGVAPDGRQIAINYSVNPATRVVTLHGIGRVWRLRDGDALLCIYNLAWNAEGVNPGTGTTSPNVIREPIQRTVRR